MKTLALQDVWRIIRRMHEMSLVASLLDIVRQEMEKHQARRLTLVTLRYGALSNVMPEALALAFEAQTVGTAFAGARLELKEEAPRLRCASCAGEFVPDAATAWAACPACGEEVGHLVLAGKEMYIDHLELE